MRKKILPQADDDFIRFFCARKEFMVFLWFSFGVLLIVLILRRQNVGEWCFYERMLVGERYRSGAKSEG